MIGPDPETINLPCVLMIPQMQHLCGDASGSAHSLWILKGVSQARKCKCKCKCWIFTIQDRITSDSIWSNIITMLILHIWENFGRLLGWDQLWIGPHPHDCWGKGVQIRPKVWPWIILYVASLSEGEMRRLIALSGPSEANFRRSLA